MFENLIYLNFGCNAENLSLTKMMRMFNTILILQKVCNCEYNDLISDGLLEKHKNTSLSTETRGSCKLRSMNSSQASPRIVGHATIYFEQPAAQPKTETYLNSYA